LPSPRRTIAEARWPDTPEFMSLAARWSPHASRILLGLIWQGCDLLCADVLTAVDTTQADRDLERSLTELLEPRIRRAMTGDEPFDVQHECWEHETALPPPARPPQYDIAFVLHANERVKWPVETKVIHHPSQVAAYVRELTDNFLTCRYAPFSSEGAMLGYLVSGNAAEAFQSIARALSCQLTHFPEFPDRPHRVSTHHRSVPRGKSYPPSLRCHHIILDLSVGEFTSRST